MEQFAAFSAIDGSDAKHAIWLLEASPSKPEPCILKPTPAELEAWATALRTRGGGQKLAVCLEQSRGPLIYALLQDDVLVLSPINPATLAKYRQAFSPSRAKDAPQEADSLLELRCHHRDRLQAWQPANAQTRTLQYRVAHRRRLVHDRTRISHRLTALWQADCPQVVQCFADIRTPLVCALRLRWPTLAAVQQVRPATLEPFFPAHNSVRKEPLATRMAAIKAAVPLTTEQAVRPSSVRLIKALATPRQTTMEALRDVADEIEKLCSMPEDSPLLASLPGAGPVYAARLTAALGTARDRWTTGEE